MPVGTVLHVTVHAYRTHRVTWHPLQRWRVFAVAREGGGRRQGSFPGV